MKKNSSLLSLILFIIIIALVYSVQNMISPNILEMSKYFGFGEDLTQLGFLTFSFTLLSGFSMLFFGYLADKFTRKWIVFSGTLIYSVFASLIVLVPSGNIGYILFFFLACMAGIIFNFNLDF